MPASGIKLVDANVWLALAFDAHEHHPSAMQWFSAQLEGTCAFCRVTQLALLRHLTNSKIMGKFVQSQQTAWSSYDVFAKDPRVICLAEPPAIEVEFRSSSQSLTPALERWTDAYLAAFARAIASQFVTFDRGFRSFPVLEVLLLS